MTEDPGLSTSNLDYLQRRGWRVHPVQLTPMTSAPVERRRLTRVVGVGRWRESPDRRSAAPDLPGSAGSELRLPTPGAAGVCRPMSEDLLVGLSGYSVPTAFLLVDDGAGVTLHVGTWSSVERERADAAVLDSRQGLMRTLLTAVYPTVEFGPGADMPSWATHGGLVLGVPTTKITAGGATLPLDRIVRAMSGARWAALVLADPVDELAVAQLRHELVNELRSAQSRGQSTLAPSPLTEAYSELLAAALLALGEGDAGGAWRTGVYLLGDGESYYRLASTWRSVFSGRDSLPEPVRVWEEPAVLELAQRWALPDVPGVPGPGPFRHPFQYQTLLTSAQLAAYIHLPVLESVGFRVRMVPDFDVACAAVPREQAVMVGQITERGRPVAARYCIKRDDLTRHALVAGVTGSGKTTTIVHILRQLQAAKVPFLVLEPAKTEYRRLLDDPVFADNLRVYTLGDEQIAPLRINPFEAPSSLPIATHIDLLKSLFNASFGMWDPLPQVLERCLHAVYRDAGWDTVANRNSRVVPGVHDERAYPTISDLHDKVDEVVELLGYEERVASDIRAALKTRLHSLRIGGKGVMLDTQRSVPFERLLDHPAIIELEPVGDDDEKAFLMGLLLLRLYEHRRANATAASSPLIHVVVVEEAHRLLANVARGRQDESNVRSKAVEAFTAMLSEVRAYGQAFLVAEQIPTKLAPDVIKNTNLKIIQRTVAGDDRAVLAATMNMSPEESAYLATLRRGEAVVFAEGDDRPVLVTIPPTTLPEGRATRALSDDLVRSHMTPRRDELPDNMFVPFEQCLSRCGTAYAFCEATRVVLSHPEVAEQVGALTLSLVVPGGDPVMRARRLAEFLRSRLPADAGDRALACAVMNAVRQFWSDHGRRNSWPYASAGTERRLTDVLLDLVLTGRLPAEASAFAAQYRILCARNADPFTHCQKLCPDGLCLYRVQAEHLLHDPRLREAFDAAAESAAQASWSDFVAVDEAAERIVGRTNPAATRSAGLCFGGQRLAFARGYTPAARQLATDALITGYDEREANTGEGR